MTDGVRPRLLAPAGEAVDSPNVSVIIPTYERREFVKRAVASVLAQTYRGFELIVVDDGSTDGTGEALTPLADTVRYHWQPNRGVSAARNAGLRLARGSIVAFLDSDDRWLPDHLAVVVETLSLNPAAVLVSTCPRFVIAGREPPPEGRLVDASRRLHVGNDLGHLPCVAVRRGPLVAIGGFNEALQVCEDSDLFVRLALRGPFTTLRRRTVVRQSSPDSLKDRGRRAGDYLDAFETMARDAIADLQTRRRDGSAELVARAHGRLHYALALRALAVGDEGTAQAALAKACRLLPELAHEADLVAVRLGLLPRAHEPAERLRNLERAARLWPDRCSDTALFLRAQAILASLAQGRPRMAARLLAAWPARATPGFARRIAPVIVRRARRRSYERLHAGPEHEAA